jgi:hypothetical protein
MTDYRIPAKMVEGVNTALRVLTALVDRRGPAPDESMVEQAMRTIEHAEAADLRIALLYLANAHATMLHETLADPMAMVRDLALRHAEAQG